LSHNSVEFARGFEQITNRGAVANDGQHWVWNRQFAILFHCATGVERWHPDESPELAAGGLILIDENPPFATPSRREVSKVVRVVPDLRLRGYPAHFSSST
jgi:hypothetical protein